MAEKLDSAALTQALKDLPRWQFDDGAAAIRRSFAFADFVEAFGFMTQVALKAQAAGHHPDWSNSYNKVEIALSTHDAGGITRNDIELAKAIDAIADRAGAKSS